MSPEDAMRGSGDRVIRAHVEGGLISIAQNEEGYTATFVPGTVEGDWNLSGSVTLGEFPHPEAAARSAFDSHDAAFNAWEPAPENVVGSDRASCTTPEVEGHHLRHTNH